MNSKRPTVSIGMPLYNEERFLSQALDSLLAQEVRDFELIISDNASQDLTSKICLEYASRDNRIHYYRNEKNLGAAKNFNYTVELASGRYFMWAAGHDMWDQSYISKCLDILETNPQVVLCYTQIGVINIEGNLIEIIEDGIDSRGLKKFERFRSVIWGLAKIPFSDPIYGLIRSDCLKQTHLVRNLWGADNMILLELSLSGAIAQIKEPLYYRRINRDRTANVERWTERYLEALDPENSKVRIKLTYSQMCYGYMGIVVRTNFAHTQKLKLLTDIWRSVLGRFWRGFLFHDVICGTIRLLFGDRGVYVFKKYSYRLVKSLGVYR